MNLAVILNLGVFALALAWVARRQKRGAALSSGVLAALLLGVVLGGALQAGYGHGHAAVSATIDWVGLVGGGYVRLLQMIVFPLVLVSILSAVTRLDDARALGRISAAVLGVLMATTAVSALIGVGVARLFRLSADGLLQGARELEQGAAIRAKAGDVADVPRLLLSLIPTNPFADLAGSRPTSLIGVVVFAALLGLAALALRRESPETGARVIDGMEVLQRLVMRLVRMVIRLTPYGVLALMTKVGATSSPDDVLRLGGFVAASYLGLALILVAHGDGDDWTAERRAAFSEHPGGLGSSLGDVDGDGGLDLFVAGWRTETASALYLNEGGRRFRRAPVVLPARVLGSAFADLDGDGHLDLVLSTGYTDVGRIEVWLGDGAGGLRSVSVPGLTDVPGRYTGLYVVDVDADGRLDVAVGSLTDPVRLFRNVSPRSDRWVQVELRATAGGVGDLGIARGAAPGGRLWRPDDCAHGAPAERIRRPRRAGGPLRRSRGRAGGGRHRALARPSPHRAPRRRPRTPHPRGRAPTR